MILRGLKAIAKACAVGDVRTVRAYATRQRDPLPLVMHGVVATIDDEALRRWRLRNEIGANRSMVPADEVIDGVVVIASALKLPVRTVYSLANRPEDPLPVYGLGTKRPWMWRSALEDWFERQAVPYHVAMKLKRARS